MGNIFVEVLSHTSFFVIFLYVFYTTYVGFIQQKSMADEFSRLFDQALNFMVITLPPSVISFVRNILGNSYPIVDPLLDNLVSQENQANNALLTPVMIGVMTAGAVGIVMSMILAGLLGESVFELIVANLISLSIIAATDIIITTLYGQFRMLDNQYLSALFALKASGGQMNCNVVKTTLDNMFPVPFIQKIVNWFLTQEGY